MKKINNFFWNTIDYYFGCFKKKHDDEVIKIHLNDYENDFDEFYHDKPETNTLLAVRPMIMNR